MLKRRTKPDNILAEGGMLDDSGEVVNGTKVPAGSLAEEVADDVPALLSEGEFVVPADVVRFVGLERLMKMRDKAKEGLERMEEMGQMGNAEEVSDSDQQFSQVDDIAFENDIDSIIGEVDRDSAAMQTQQMFAAGGFVTGTDLSKAVQNPAVDVRYYKHDDGRVMYITHINDKPMTAIPDGFKEVSPEEARQVGKKAEETAAATGGGATGGTGGDGGGGDSVGVSGEGGSIGGLGPTGLASVGLGLMGIGEQLGKAPTVSGKVAGKAATAAGQAIADQSISQTSQGFATMGTAASVPGMMSVSGPQGQVSTVSTPASIAAANMGMFGTTGTGSGTGGGFGGGFGFGGVSASDTGNIGFGSGSLGGFATDGVSGGSATGADGGFGFGGVSASDTGGLGFGGGSLGGFAGGGGDDGGFGGGFGDSGPSGSSGAGGASAAGPGDDGGASEGADGSPGGGFGGDGGGGGGGGGGASEGADGSPGGGFGGDDGGGGGGGGGGGDGTYCCSRMVDLGIWSEHKELARMHVWHHKQPKWWRAGYSVWGKVVADTLFKKEGFWTDVMKEFYDYHIKKKPRTLKSTIGDVVIYPGVAICSLFVREAPETTRYVRQ